MSATYDVRLAGDAALLVVPARGDAMWEDAARIAEALRRTLGANVLDIVPAADSVLVRFDPRRQEAALLMASARAAALVVDDIRVAGRRVRIGVHFGEGSALDLADVAARAEMPAADVVRALTTAQLRVGFLGYLAGFPYMYGVPPALAVGRLKTPRTSVPVGSVALAGGMCGIYPRATPGGWHIVGRTAATLFDPHRDPPALLLAGDTVTLHPVASVADAVADVQP